VENSLFFVEFSSFNVVCFIEKTASPERIPYRGFKLQRRLLKSCWSVNCQSGQIFKCPGTGRVPYLSSFTDRRTLVTPFKNYFNKILYLNGNAKNLCGFKIWTLVDIDRKLTVEQNKAGIAQKTICSRAVLRTNTFFRGLFYRFSFLSFSVHTFLITVIDIHSPRPLSISSLLVRSEGKTSLGCQAEIRTRACITAGQRTANWATLHPTELRCTLTELRCTLTELRCTRIISFIS
jgi:hypothetical protein